MTNGQINDIITKYEEHLSAYGVPMQFTAHGIVPAGDQAARHVLWMCSKVRNHLVEGRREKALRWLGFVQGVLWTFGHYTLDDVRDHNGGD